jgi:hypothetical protein
MSYCRWSSNDFQCDVYVYESRDGFWTHVAARRPVFDGPLPPPADLPRGFTEAQFEAWIGRRRAVDAMVDRATLVDIGGPHDGTDFCDRLPGECADRLVMLRDAGYWVPQSAIDALRAEQDEINDAVEAP